MTETSVGEGWNDITDVIEADQLYGGQPRSEFYMLSTMKRSQLKSWFTPLGHMVAGESQATRTYNAIRIIKSCIGNLPDARAREKEGDILVECQRYVKIISGIATKEPDNRLQSDQSLDPL
jgi:hypothetical protein